MEEKDEVEEKVVEVEEEVDEMLELEEDGDAVDATSPVQSADSAQHSRRD